MWEGVALLMEPDPCFPELQALRVGGPFVLLADPQLLPEPTLQFHQHLSKASRSFGFPNNKVPRSGQLCAFVHRISRCVFFDLCLVVWLKILLCALEALRKRSQSGPQQSVREGQAGRGRWE